MAGKGLNVRALGIAVAALVLIGAAAAGYFTKDPRKPVGEVAQPESARPRVPNETVLSKLEVPDARLAGEHSIAPPDVDLDIEDIAVAADDALPYEGRLQGTLRMTDGALFPLLQRASLQLSPVDESCPCNANQGLDATGEFELTELVPGTYKLSLFAQSRLITALAPDSVTILPGGEWTHADIAVSAGIFRWITGDVLGPQGQPVADAEVLVSHRAMQLERVRTGADGRFEIPMVEHEGLYIAARHLEYSSAGQELALNENDVTLTLGARVDVAGLVRDAQTGEPIPKFTVSDGEQRQVADPGGRFLLRGVDADRGLHFRAPRYVEQHVLLSGEPPPPLTGIEVLLEPMVSLQGIVAEASGAPLEAAAVYLAEPTIARPDETPDTRADTAGRFVLADLEPRKYVLTIIHPGFAIEGHEVDLATGEQEHRFVLKPDAALDVTLELADPASEWSVSWYVLEHGRQHGPDQVEETVTGGIRRIHGRISSLSATMDSLLCNVTGPSGEALRYTFPAAFTLEPGKTVRVVKRIVLPTAKLDVFVTRGGVPFTPSNVGYSRTAGEFHLSIGATVQEPGHYVFTALPDGPGRIAINAENLLAVPPWQQAIDLAPGESRRLDAVLDLADLAVAYPASCGSYCILFLVEERNFTPTLDLVRNGANLTDDEMLALPGARFWIAGETPQGARVAPGTYRYGYFGPDNQLPESFSDALETASPVRLAAGDNGTLPIP